MDAIQDNHNSQIWAAKSTLRPLVPCPKICLGLSHAAKIEGQVQLISELGTANTGHWCTPAVEV